MRCSAFLLLLFSCIHAAAQFSPAGADYAVYIGGENGLYGNGLSAFDFNGDGLEDLTCCTRNNGLRTFQNTGIGYEEVFFLPYIDGDIKHVLWVDYDNDADADLFVSIAGGSVRLFQHEPGWAFTDITSALPLPSYGAITYGASWGDYDRDGLLDVYICNYEYNINNPNHNWLLHQYAPGQFEELALALGVDNGYKASFQSVWTDVNMDGYPDLYVINDRLHGNTLYVQENGVFVDQSASYQLGLELESMCNSWADYDGDLDLDVYVSNSDEGNRLMRNDGLFFTDVSEETQTEVNSICWASIWMDYDHNGRTDLHVATSASYYLNNYNALLTNNGDDAFTQSFIQGDNHTVLCEVQSDFNNDGYWDIVQMEQFPTDVQFFRNQGGSRHWLKYALQGQSSNRDGIGACVYAYSDGQASLQMKFCGESYLVQRSQYEMISLNNAGTLDSLKIVWPSGWVDNYYNLSADTLHLFTEGETLQDVELHHTKCPDAVLDLFPHEGSDYVWSTGDTTEFISVTNPGVYSVEYQNAFSLLVNETHIVEEVISPEIEWQIQQPTCFGMTDGMLSMESELLLSITQSSQGIINGNEVVNLGSGGLWVTLSDTLSCLWNEELVVTQPETLQVTFESPVVCPDAQSEFIPEISGGTAPWTYLIDGTSFALVSYGEHTLEILDGNGCFLDTIFHVAEYTPMEVDIYVNETCPGFPASAVISIEGGEGEVEWYCDANSMESILPGVYTVFAHDQAGCYIEEIFVVDENPEPVFETMVEYNAENDCFQIAVTSPDLKNYMFQWSNGSTGAVLSCVEEGAYHCAIEDVNGCNYFIEVLVTRMNENHASGVIIYPNPCEGDLFIEGAGNQHLKIYDAQGKCVKNVFVNTPSFKIDLSDRPKGLYILNLHNKWYRIIKV